MPLKRCQIDNQDGWKWGDEGKCYVGPDAKEKAMKQGVAIGDYEQDELSSKIERIQELRRRVKVGFDYDGVITKNSVRNIIRELIKDGSTEVYVVTARTTTLGLYPILQELGIPSYRVYAVGSNNKKIEKVKELGLEIFYDNNKDVIDQLPGIGKLIK